MPNEIERAIANAKQALASAKRFTRSTGDTDPSMFAPKPKPVVAPPPKPAARRMTLADEAHSAGEGIRLRMQNEDAARQALGSMKKGGVVPKTGPYILHEGEKVVPKDKVQKMDKDSMKKEVMKKATAGLGGKEKKKHKIHMHIQPIEDGRFMVDHEYRGGEEPMEGTKHAPQNIQELLDHVKKHYGEEMAESAKEKAGEEAE